MHVDSALPVNHVLVRLVSILLMSLPLPTFLADLQELHLIPEKIAKTVPFLFGKIAHLLHVQVDELAPARCTCVLRYFLPKF